MLFPVLFSQLASCLICSTGSCNKTASNCVTLPKPMLASSTDFFIKGSSIIAYRNTIARQTYDDVCDITRMPFVLIFVNDKVTCGFETYVDCVVATLECIAEDAAKDEKFRSVLRAIYDAATSCNAETHDLLAFTATALHNMNLFTKFTKPDFKNVTIGEVCRGLMQYKSEQYYKSLSKVSAKNDYIKMPALLDTFTAETIRDEFVVFQQTISKSTSGSLTSMETMIIRMAPDEASLLTGRAGIRNIEDPVLLKRLERRLSIFNLLDYCLQKNASRNSLESIRD